MTEGVRDEPWWASGAGPGEGLHDEDPLDRHAAGRRGTPAGRGGAWWQDAVDALAEAARATDRGTRPREAASGGSFPHADGRVCHACPVCVALRALEGSRPDVVAHLAEAFHHLSQAARAFAEAQVHATGGDPGLRRVDLDDE